MKRNNLHKIELWMFFIAVIILAFGLYYLGPSITGFVIKELSYTDEPNLVVTSNGNYTWQLKEIGDLKSLKIDGGVTKSGKARAYIENNGIKYLIFDSAKIGEEKEIEVSNETSLITGFVVKEDKKGKDDENKTESDEEKKKKNHKPDWIGDDKFTINGTTAINLSQHFTDEDGDSLTYAASEVEGLETTINNEIVAITPKSSQDFNAIITFTASDGVDSKSEVVDLIVIVKKERQINITPKINHAPEWIGIDSFILNRTLSIDLLQYFADEDNDTLSFSISDVADISEDIDGSILTLTTTLDNFNASLVITANDGNLSVSKEIKLIVPLTPILPITKTITIDLAYKSGTIYDANDNGEESINGVVDLTIENTKFNWDVDSSRLCTRWEVYNAEEGQLTTFCNGNNDCCAFVGLLPTKQNWDEVYYSVFGKDGAGYNNIVAAQVLYYDVNLSVDNIKSEIYYSGWANLSVKFFEEEIEFFDECIETCSLSGLNKSSYTLIFEIEDDAVLRIDKIKYNVLIDVKNNLPLLLQNFSTINISKNKNTTINLSEYFIDPDGDALSYGYYKADNITILFDGNVATVIPDKGIDGIRFTYLTANDSENIAVSNLFMVNISEEKFKPRVEIGKPVRWLSKVLIDVSNVSSVNLTLPETASNVTITILNQTIQQEVSSEKIKVIEDGRVKDKEMFEIEKKLEKISRKISILEEARQKDALKVVVDEREFDRQEIDLKLEELYRKKLELEQQLNQLLNINNNLITANVIALTETIINETLPVLFINESLTQNIEVTVEYETEAPISIEDEINAYTKQIKVVSETSYEDVISYTTLNDVPQQAISLYWIKDSTKELVTDVQYIDANSNNLIDKIEWIIPHLSNQTYEVTITILNVQSYPTVGGNWTVAFNTTGTGNLTIYGYNGTSYAEVPDDSSTINDLEYLETRCDNVVLNTTIVCANGEQMPYEVYKIKKRIAEIKKRLNELNQSG